MINIRMNSSGKVLTIFVVIIAILLVSLTAISMFFFQKEREHRENLEALLDKSQEKEAALQVDLREIKKQNFLLQEKNKEADEKINGLLDDLELEKGVREELKLELSNQKEKYESEAKAKDQLREQLENDTKAAQQKVIDLENALKAGNQANEELQAKIKSYEAGGEASSANASSLKQEATPEAVPKEGVELDKIVVAPNKVPEGRILSIDLDTDFVIVNLGEKDGVKIGNIMSVYRGKDFLGDIKVTRVQPEMLAADLIPPFSSRTVRKSDQVILKE